jgi:NLI interacting factor-like phosphatase
MAPAAIPPISSSQRQHKRSKHAGPRDRSAAKAATTFSTPIIIDDDSFPEPYVPDVPFSAGTSGKPTSNPIVIDDDKFPEPAVSGTLLSANGTNVYAKPPVSDLKVFVNFDCLAKTSLFTSLAATKAFEYQLDQRSKHGGFCDYVRVPLFKDKSDRFFDNYAVVEKRQGLTPFLETICPRYQVHLITDKTKLVATAVMKTAMSPLLTTDKHSFCNAKAYWTDRCGINVVGRQIMNLPKTFASVYKEEMPGATLSHLWGTGPTAQQWARTVLVDATLMNHVSRPANGILVPEFSMYKSQGDVEKDDALFEVAFLLQDLAPADIDVQKVLAERSDLSTRLQEEHGTFCEQHQYPWFF